MHMLLIRGINILKNDLSFQNTISVYSTDLLNKIKYNKLKYKQKLKYLEKTIVVQKLL